MSSDTDAELGSKARLDFDIRQDDLTDEAVQALLALHLAGMRSNTPAGHVFALDWSGLKQPDVTVWTAWAGDRVAAIGALKQHAGDQGEIKSMRTHPDFLRKGAGAALLETIIDTARQRGVRRLSLETGRNSSFDPALALYRRRGFVDGEAFGDYVRSEYNQFLHLAI